ncbi:class I SAM-dependent methyltransferase [Bacteroides sedimenti]|uniref:Methyltransferase type 11 n=1 Tax=Bacteroides sedimenti TaxID=2136147 RepID=A0ABM8IEA2_9BACE
MERSSVLKLIADFFQPLYRQGPGGRNETLKALSFLSPSCLSRELKIADIGCGTGAQTLVLAENTKGTITAIDFLPEMLDGLNARMKLHGFQDRVASLLVSMDNLPFNENELDLIWAEGSIFGIGFNRGITEWKKYLKTGGLIAVTEMSWLTINRSFEIEQYLTSCYSEVDLVSSKIRQMESAGYLPVANFVLPETCWTINYYKLVQGRFNSFLKEQRYSEEAKQFVGMMKEEIDYYEKYKAYYGYVFYIGKKIG